MQLKGTKSAGRRTGGFRIPISSISIEVGMQNLVGSDISRGFPSMRTIHKCKDDAKTPISKPNWCDHCGRIVEKDEVMKGYEVGKNEFVYLTNEEVEEAKTRFETKSMKVLSVSTIDSLKPYNVLESYLLTPASEETKKKKSKDSAQNEKFYALLADKLVKDNLYIIGKVFSVRGELFMAVGGTIEAGTPMLVGYSLFYADEMKDIASAGYKAPEITEKERELMGKLVEKEKKDADFTTIKSELKEVFDKKIESRNVGEVPSADAPVAETPKVEADALSELEKALAV